jgi:hypothetical protein
MAVFHIPADSERLDWRLLQNGPVTLYHRLEILAEDIAWLRQHGYEVHQFHCADWPSEDAFHADVSQKLSFPDYYGRNLHALNDCMSDLPVPDAGGTVLQFNRFDLFVAGFPEFAWNILDIAAHNSWWFLMQGSRLITLLQSDDPRLKFERVGGHSVLWNTREWLDKSRGV